MTAERKKGKYTYYRCTGFHGACGNTYIREEELGRLLGSVIAPIQITPAIANDIASALRRGTRDDARRCADAERQLQQRHRSVLVKLDRGYEDFVGGKVSEEFWTRKSQEWEAELLSAGLQVAVLAGQIVA